MNFNLSHSETIISRNQQMVLQFPLLILCSNSTRITTFANRFISPENDLLIIGSVQCNIKRIRSLSFCNTRRHCRCFCHFAKGFHSLHPVWLPLTCSMTVDYSLGYCKIEMRLALIARSHISPVSVGFV